MPGCADAIQDFGDIGVGFQEVQQFPRYLGLFVDLFEHKMGIAAFLDGIHFNGDVLRFALDETAVCNSVQFNTVCIERHNLAVFQA